jgi:hypothetical protein
LQRTVSRGVRRQEEEEQQEQQEQQEQHVPRTEGAEACEPAWKAGWIGRAMQVASRRESARPQVTRAPQAATGKGGNARATRANTRARGREGANTWARGRRAQTHGRESEVARGRGLTG